MYLNYRESRYLSISAPVLKRGDTFLPASQSLRDWRKPLAVLALGVTVGNVRPTEIVPSTNSLVTLTYKLVRVTPSFLAFFCAAALSLVSILNMTVEVMWTVYITYIRCQYALCITKNSCYRVCCFFDDIVGVPSYFPFTSSFLNGNPRCVRNAFASFLSFTFVTTVTAKPKTSFKSSSADSGNIVFSLIPIV